MYHTKRLKEDRECMNIRNKSTFEPPHDKTNKMACVPSEDSDQPGHTHMPFCWFCHEAVHLYGIYKRTCAAPQ